MTKQFAAWKVSDVTADDAIIDGLQQVVVVEELFTRKVDDPNARLDFGEKVFIKFFTGLG